MADLQPVAGIDVLVALPAHDEADVIVACLESIGVAAEAALDVGLVSRCRVAVSAHRCTDRTAALASRTMARLEHVEPLVVVDDDEIHVGEVRTRLVMTAVGPDAALGLGPLAPSAWVFSTDADSLVPVDWITGVLTVAQTTGADLVLGLADLLDWEVDDETRAAYERIVAAGVTTSGHTHAYAANLAISLAAFRRVDGFPGVVHGEDHALAAAVRAAGLEVTSPLSPRVLTSARMPGRARIGLGSLLQSVAAADVAS